MNRYITEMLPSTSRQHVSSPTATNNNISSNSENNNSSNNNNQSYSNISNSSFSSNNCSNNTNSSFSGSNYSNNSCSNNTNSNNSNSILSNNSTSNDEMDIQDLNPTPEMRTREPSIYDYIPKSKKKKEYIYWKMLKDQENMQSCLKMFKKCNLEEDTKFKHVSTSKDSSGIRLKRKIARKKRDSLAFGATSTGRVSRHRHQHHHQQSTSSDAYCPPHYEDLPNLIPLIPFTISNVPAEPIYPVDGFDNNNSE